MQKTLQYSITHYHEEGIPIQGVRHMTDTLPNTYWETYSDFATLSIEFDPVAEFELKLCVCSSMLIKIFHESIELYSHHSKPSQVNKAFTISSKKFKVSELSIQYDTLMFEFQRLDRTMKVKYLILQSPKSGKKIEKKTDRILPNSVINKEKLVKNRLQPKEKELKNNFIQEKSDYRFDEDINLERQQKRLMSIVDKEKNNGTIKDSPKKKYESIPNGSGHSEIPEIKFAGSDNIVLSPQKHPEKLVPTNSYASLLAGHVIYCNIIDPDTSNLIIELIQVSGGCFMESELDFCTLIITDSRSFSPSSKDIPIVKPDWLLESISSRHLQSFQEFQVNSIL